MDPEGIRNGSTTNDLNTRTMKNTGKNDFEYSTIMGLCLDAFRNRAKNIASISQMIPVTAVAITKKVGKSIDIIYSHGQWMCIVKIYALALNMVTATQ